MAIGIGALIFIVFVVISVLKGLRIVQEYERGVIFRLGRCVGAKGPGLFFIFPIFDKMRKVNLQTQAVPVASQQVITKDNVTVAVDAVAYFRVKDPVASVLKIQNWFNAAQLVAQTSLRSIIGRHELDQLLGERDRINTELKLALDEQTEAWGVQVDLVEVRDVGLPEQMQRAMARQAEAERERRAKVIAADGEYEAAQKLGEAARRHVVQPRRHAAAHAADDGRDCDGAELDDYLPDSGGDHQHLPRSGRAFRADRVVEETQGGHVGTFRLWSDEMEAMRAEAREVIAAGAAAMNLDAKPSSDLAA